MAIDTGRVKALFQSAIERSDPAERRAFLDREVGDDSALRERLNALLAAHDQPPGALDLPLDAGLGASSDHPDATGTFSSEAPIRPDADGPTRGIGNGEAAIPLDTVIAGRYKLRQVIGEGGMGSVYLAEQLRPVKRLVALKLIKPGMDTRTVLARFESERQALALMDHPHIAKVLDAGSTDQGRPFFVMELVKGVPITEYCDRLCLGITERLAIFRHVCSAVQHAHQKGIIHRDLKPSNVLVESHDEKPVPKVIDFGLAKATSGMKLTDQSLFTAFGLVTGTPMYMAPEQASFNALDVDTRADIYALGVVLYELLTGSTPIRRETIQRAALDEMLRVIREDEPPTPSSRISTSDALPSLAANRHIEPTRLSRFVRGDLDWIVMKALAKERHRRYDSAIGLADDVERFLRHEPVSAGPPTAAYRMRKFVRRHRGRVVAAALVLLALVAGVAGTTLGLIEARRQGRIAVAEAAAKEEARRAEAEQRARAEDQRRQAEKRLEQVAKMNEILGSIFRDLDPRSTENGGRPLSAILGERLDQAVAEVEGEATGDPLVVARMQQVLGKSLLGLGDATRAIDVLAKAFGTRVAGLGPDHPDTLATMNELAEAYWAAGGADRSLPLFEAMLSANRIKLGPDHPGALATLNAAAVAYQGAGKFDRAVPMFEAVLAARRAQLGPDHPDTLDVMSNLAWTYRNAGRLDLAVPMLEESLKRHRSKLGPDHPNTIGTMGLLASTYRDMDEHDRALPLLESGLAALKAGLGRDHPKTLTSMNSLASAYRAAGKLDLAVTMLAEALEAQKIKLGPDHPDTLATMSNLASAYQAAGRPDRAAPLLRDLAAIRRRRAGADPAAYTKALASLGLGLIEAKDWVGAESPCRESLALLEAKEPDAWTTFSTRSMLGGALLGQGKTAEAEPLLRSGYEGMAKRADKIPSRARPRLVAALDRLIALGEATGKIDEVKAWKAERTKLDAAAPKPGEAKK
jgi:tetratricopeptide (TPR) repeat protein